MPRGRPPKPKEGPVEPKKKRAASLALSDAQHIALDKFATDHPEWDQNSVPDELLVGDIFVPFTKKQLIKKIQNHFQAKADQIRAI